VTTWLLKTEPDDFSYADLVRAKREPWTGVKNPAARIHMRAARKGDEAYVYHTGKVKAIVGLARLVTDMYEDPSDPGLNGKGDVKAPLFDIAPVAEATMPMTLAEIKADDRFKDFDLVKMSRLSVMPVPAKLDRIIRKHTGL